MEGVWQGKEREVVRGRGCGREVGRGGEDTYLKIHTLAFVRDDKVGIHRAFGASSLLCNTLTRQRVPL